MSDQSFDKNYGQAKHPLVKRWLDGDMDTGGTIHALEEALLKAETAQSSTERRFPICKDHTDADWNQPTLDDDACILCRLFYLEAQESLLEEWQQRAQKAEEAIKDMERPLDAQMARLNETVVRLNGENEQLRAKLSAIAPITQEKK